MTREEAIYTIERLAHTEAKWPGTEDTLEALDMALSALRPVSREQVEKVWKSEWTDSGKRDLNGVPKPFAISCKRCGSSAGVSWMKFCPSCGAPMTDEAVQMVMERINKMEETGNGLG